MGLTVLTADFDQRFRVLRTRLNITGILIDALLGTGVSRPISGKLATLMKQVRAGLKDREEILKEQSHKKLVSITNVIEPVEGSRSSGIEASVQSLAIIAVDCPSGLNCDTGDLDPLAFPADLTVTFAGPKRGHFRFPGAAACGELVVADIGIGETLPEVANVSLNLLTAASAGDLLPKRSVDGHKGTFGWVLIAAGSDRYWGAPALAGRAAYRAGAGLVAMAAPADIRPALATQLPEATYPLIEEKSRLGAKAAEAILTDLSTYKAILIGPGISEASEFMTTFLEDGKDREMPSLVVDADGLNLLAGMDGWPAKLPAGTILTPHPGEMARLTGVSIKKLKQYDRVDLARSKAVEWNCVVLLKGAYTVVASPDDQCLILPFANPALATAGSGDVLSGVIVSLLGQGLGPFEAAALGGYLHGGAAQVAGSDAGLLATDLADLVPTVRNNLLKDK
jgi:NAD(P)H-hydrate epimerase